MDEIVKARGIDWLKEHYPAAYEDLKKELENPTPKWLTDSEYVDKYGFLGDNNLEAC